MGKGAKFAIFSADDTPVAVASKKLGIFYLPVSYDIAPALKTAVTQATSLTAFAYAAVAEAETALWHARLGHLSEKKVPR